MLTALKYQKMTLVCGWASFLHLPVGYMQAKAQPTFLPAVPRLVAIGDLHGDLGKARRAFRLGGLTDVNDRWIGGTTTAVQVAFASHASVLPIISHQLAQKAPSVQFEGNSAF